MSAVAASIRVFPSPCPVDRRRASRARAGLQRRAKTKHPAMCAKGVRIYTDRSRCPTQHDTLSIPPADGPFV